MAKTPSANASIRAVPRMAPSPSSSSRASRLVGVMVLDRPSVLNAVLKPLVQPGKGAYLSAMADHDHHLHEGDLLHDAATRRMTESGEQWTDMRSSVFEALAGFDRPASAYDIAEAVSKARGHRIAANSVYRIFDLFVGSNLAIRVESANAYVANAHPGASTTHLPDLRQLRAATTSTTINCRAEFGAGRRRIRRFLLGLADR